MNKAEIKMNKVASLTDDMYNRIAKDGKLGTSLRELLGIPKTKKMGIGDSMCMIGRPSEIKDVFKYVQNGREIFYIVINPLDDKMAFCYVIYPC